MSTIENARLALAALRKGDWDMGDVGAIEIAITALEKVLGTKSSSSKKQ